MTITVDLFEKQVFVLHGITYLPHYNIRSQYVSPGYGKSHYNLYTKRELMDAGAQSKTEMLWERAW
jgi:hypothetical protein